MSLMAANEESDPSAILNGFWVTLFFCFRRCCLGHRAGGVNGNVPFPAGYRISATTKLLPPTKMRSWAEASFFAAVYASFTVA